MRHLILITIFLVPAANLQASLTQDVLFLGNSFTQGVGGLPSIPELVREIAFADNRGPNVVDRSSGGSDFLEHINRLENEPYLLNGAFAPEQTWDYVIMQDFSTHPTRIGDVNLHRERAVLLYEQLADHSPDVVPVLFETWARGEGFFFYEGRKPTFPGGPAAMQSELRVGYNLSREDIDAATEPGKARVAPVGDAWENAEWDNLHAGDLYHANARGNLLSALVIFSTVFEQPTSEIDLTSLLDSLGLGTADGEFLTTISDNTVFPMPCDLNLDAKCSVLDIDQLTNAIHENNDTHSFDLNGDENVNFEDRRVWVEDLQQTYFGDSNLDGEFDAADLVTVLQAGEFNDAAAENSTWATGDWDGNREFDIDDIFFVLQKGNFGLGPKAKHTIGVPEPTGISFILMLVWIPLSRSVRR